jgi:penicillin-binding protein 2
VYRDGPESEPRSTSQLSLRVAILSTLALVMFSAIFFRLWYLEILSGDRYLELARDNQVREVRVQPPRGQIIDRDGKVLVDNRTGLALQLDPRDLPKDIAARGALYRRISGVAGMTPRQITQKVQDVQEKARNSPVILTRDLGSGKIFYLREHQAQFPGVSIERVFVRDYKQGNLAAHLFGNVGEVTEEQLKEPRYESAALGDIVGQSGIEYEYDRFLRGQAGTTEVQVDALGRPKGGVTNQAAVPGDNVRLTIDADLQETAEGALSSFGLPGAAVAMDTETGDVLAMASTPSFDPNIFTKSISPRQYKALSSDAQGAPLINRAIQGLYPTGSVFKAITGLAALDGELITPGEIINDTGEMKVDVLTLRNANDAVNGPIDMEAAFKVSSDIYFYRLGLNAPAKGDGGLIQDWARNLGLDTPTGVDLPGEAAGTIPTPAWRARLNRQGIGDGRPWRAGDNINLAVGQGDVQAHPLQMAVAYAALANKGKVVRPHIADRIENVSGEVLQEVRPAPRRQIDIPEQYRTPIMEGLRRAAMEPGGTSYRVFGNFPTQIAGKTGTAERPYKGVIQDQSWYVALAPADDPEIVVAVTIEQGGFGVDAAAPVAARMLERHLGIDQVPQLPVAEPVPGSAATLE